MQRNEGQRQTWSTARPLGIGLGAVAFFVLTVGVWGTQARISGAVMGPGTVQVTSARTAIQHSGGGIVTEILVDNGDAVRAGDVVVRLDDIQLRAELNATENELFETLASSARLRAIIDAAADLDIAPLLAEQAELGPAIEAIVERQRRQLQSHYDSVSANQRILNGQIRQVDEQIAASEVELASKHTTLELIDEELLQVEDAVQDGLIAVTELTDLRKEHAATEGEISRLTAGIAGLRGERLGIELNLQSLVPDFKEEASEQLSQAQRDSGRLIEERNAILDQIANLDIRSPVNGIVHDSRVQGLRSVVLSGSPLMFIVPDDRPISVAARIDISDIDQVRPGQPAMLKFTAFDLRAMPTIHGVVETVSADALRDEATRTSFYNVEVSLPPEELEKLGDNALISGMPVSVYLTTGDRAPLAYVTRPVALYLDRAFREP